MLLGKTYKEGTTVTWALVVVTAIDRTWKEGTTLELPGHPLAKWTEKGRHDVAGIMTALTLQ